MNRFFVDEIYVLCVKVLVKLDAEVMGHVGGDPSQLKPENWTAIFEKVKNNPAFWSRFENEYLKWQPQSNDIMKERFYRGMYIHMLKAAPGLPRILEGIDPVIINSIKNRNYFELMTSVHVCVRYELTYHIFTKKCASINISVLCLVTNGVRPIGVPIRVDLWSI